MAVEKSEEQSLQSTTLLLSVYYSSPEKYGVTVPDTNYTGSETIKSERRKLIIPGGPIEQFRCK